MDKGALVGFSIGDQIGPQPVGMGAAEEAGIQIGHGQGQDRVPQIVAGLCFFHQQCHVGNVVAVQAQGDHQAQKIIGGIINGHCGFVVPADALGGFVDGPFEIAADPLAEQAPFLGFAERSQGPHIFVVCGRTAVAFFGFIDQGQGLGIAVAGVAQVGQGNAPDVVAEDMVVVDGQPAAGVVEQVRNLGDISGGLGRLGKVDRDPLAVAAAAFGAEAAEAPGNGAGRVVIFLKTGVDIVIMDGQQAGVESGEGAIVVYHELILVL